MPIPNANRIHARSAIIPHPNASVVSPHSTDPARYSVGVMGEAIIASTFRVQASSRNVSATWFLVRNTMSHSSRPPSRNPSGIARCTPSRRRNTVRTPHSNRSTIGHSVMSSSRMNERTVA